MEYPDESWDVTQFFDHAKIMTFADDHPTYGFVSPGLMTSDLDSLLFMLGSDLYIDAEKKVNYTSDEHKAAIQRYIDLITTASPHKSIQNYDVDKTTIEPIQSFIEGRVGMWFGQPDEFELYSQLPADIGISLLPYGWGPVGLDSYSVSSFYISASTTKQTACWEFMKHVQDSYTLASGALPVRRSAISADVVNWQDAETLVDEYLALMDQSILFEKSGDVDYYWLYRAIDKILQGHDMDQELLEAEQLTNAYIDCLERSAAPSSCATSVDPTYQGYALLAPE